MTGISIKNGHACGVSYRDFQEPGDKPKEVFAKCVVANAALPHVAQDLLPAPANQRLLKKIRDQKLSISILCVYLKLKRSLSALGNRSYAIIFGDKRWTRFTQFAEACRINDYNVKGIGFTDYSIIDNGLPEGSQYSGVLAIVDSLNNWERLTETEYDERKAVVARILIDRLEEIVPGVKEEIVDYDVVTPLTLYRQTNNPAGTPYGFALIPGQHGIHRMSNSSPVKGLYFASAWSRPGPAYPGAICGGYNCAKRVVRDLL